MRKRSPAEMAHLGHHFWVMQEGKEIWVVESATRPESVSAPGKASRTVLHSAANREQAEDLAKRATTGTGYTLRATK
jgi:hypothetical protein